MTIHILDKPTKELISEIDNKLGKFNKQHWEVTEQIPLAAVSNDVDNKLIAGVTARTFGDWLLIDNLWVDESHRGKNIGTKLLKEIENAAIKRGCQYALLDTLNFQARPFYEKNGYVVKWVQENYPKTGCKYFMVKNLI